MYYKSGKNYYFSYGYNSCFDVAICDLFVEYFYTPTYFNVDLSNYSGILCIKDVFFQQLLAVCPVLHRYSNYRGWTTVGYGNDSPDLKGVRGVI